MTLKEGLTLAVKAIVKTLDTSSPKPEKLEVLVISKSEDGKI